MKIRHFLALMLMLAMFSATILGQRSPMLRVKSNIPTQKHTEQKKLSKLTDAGVIQIFESDQNQTQLSIAVNPGDESKVLAVATTDNGLGAYYSTDGGLTWDGTNDIGGPTNNYAYKPSLGWDASGNAYLSYIDYYPESGYHVYVAKSTTGGASWGVSAATVPDAGTDPSWDHIAIDGSNIYVGWTDFSGFDSCADNSGPFPVKLARSINNGGTSFSTYGAISGSTIGPNKSAFAQGVNLSIGVNHELYAVWSCNDSWDCNNSTTWPENAIGFNKSTDNGASWGTASRIIPITGIRNW